MESGSNWTRRGLLAAAGALAAGPILRPAAAAAADDYLAGATLRIVSSTTAGSPGELLARIAMRTIERLVPGCRVVVEIVAGANGRIAAKDLWFGEGDGLHLALLNSNLLFAQLLGEEELPFDLLGFDWVGGFTVDRRVMIVSHRSGIETLEQLRAREAPLLFPGVATTSGHVIDGQMLNAALGLRLKSVTGYRSAQRATAFLSGEVEGLLGSYESVLPMLEADAGRILLRMSDGALPAPWNEVVRLSELLPPERQWVAGLIESQCRLGRGFAAPPGTEPARLQRLRALFAALVADPQFQQEIAATGMSLEPTEGPALRQVIDGLLESNRHLADDFRALLACGRLRENGGDC